jgi:hypothetical protein
MPLSRSLRAFGVALLTATIAMQLGALAPAFADDTTTTTTPPSTTTPPDTTTTTQPDASTTTTTAPPTTTTEPPTTTTAPPTTTTTLPPDNGPKTTLIVETKSGLSSSEQGDAITSHGGTETSSIPELNLHFVDVPQATAYDSLNAYASDANVKSVSLDSQRTAEGAATDPAYGTQWALPKIGWENVHGVVNPSGSATIAVLDTGVDGNTPDLAGRLVPGWSFDNSNPATDPSGHGTHVATIAAAAADDGNGIAGVGYASGIKVMPVKVLGADGTGLDTNVLQGLQYAVNHGADVVEMAFSGPGYSPALQNAINNAWSHGVVVVAAAGNGGTSDPQYPAGDAKVVGVGGTDQNDAVASGSDTGQAVFIGAPGVDITASDASGTTSFSGTSAASAITAGAVALLAANDSSAGPATIVGRLARNADPIGALGNGRVNIDRAINDSSTDGVTPVGAPGGGGPIVSKYVTAAQNASSGDGVMAVSPTSVAAGATGQSFAFTFTNTNAGNKDFPANSQVELDFPSAWPAPQITTSGAAGFVTVSASTCTAPATGVGALSTASITGGTAVLVNMQCLGGSANHFTLTYAPVTAPTSAGSTLFQTKSRSGGSGGAGTGTNLASGNSPSITVNAGTATQLSFSTQPGGTITGGVVFGTQPAVTAKDAFNNVVSGVSVTLAIGTNPSSGTLTCTTNPATTNSSGIATFGSPGCKIDKSGNGYTLTANAAGPISATSNPFNVAAGGATHLAFGTQPSNTVAGVTMAPPVTVQLLDAGNNLTTSTASVALTPSSGTLNGTTSQAAVSGVATFSDLSMNSTATGRTLAAASTGLTGATSSSFNITAAAASKLSVSAPSPATPTAGGNFSVTVTSQDQFGNTSNVVATTGVSLAVSTGTGLLGGTTSRNITSGSSSVTFTNLTYTKAENGVVLTATATSGDSLTAANSPAFNVTANTATKLAIISVNGGVNPAAGSPFNVVIQSQDANGNPSNVVGATGITLARQAGTGTLGGTTTGTIGAGANSTTLSVTYSKAESGVILQASRTSGDNLAAGNSAAFTVVPGTPTQLAITNISPSTPTQNVGFNVTVVAQDVNGNASNVSLDTLVTLSVSTGTGSIAGGATTGTISNGTNQVVITGVKYDTIQNGVVLTASAGGFTSGNSSAFNVIGSASKLAITNISPSTPTVNAGFGVTVQSQDTNGTPSPVVSDTLVTLSLKTGTGHLTGTLTGTIHAGQNSVTISGALYDVGESGVVITATATSGDSLTAGDSAPFTVSGATQLAITSVNGGNDPVAGSAFSITVQSQNGSSVANPVTADTGVTISLFTGTGTLSGTVTGTILAGQSSAVISGLSYNKAEGGVVLRATRTSGDNLTAGNSAPFTVDPGTATKLAITQVSPASPTAGVGFNVTLVAQDANGNLSNVVANTSFSLTRATGSGTLGGTTTGTIAAGTNSFTVLGVTYTKAESGVSVTATVTSGDALTAATSAAFTVVAGPASQLVITTINPSSPTAASPFSVTVVAQDSQGNLSNVVANTNISLSVSTGTGFISGSTTGTITAGSNSVTISGVSYNKAETGVVLTATRTSGDNLTAGNSAPFTVVAGVAARLVILSVNGVVDPVTAGTAFNVAIQAQDLNGNPSNVSANTGVSLSVLTGTGTLGGTPTGTITSGTNSLTLSVTYNKAETPVQLRATRTSGNTLSSGDSSTFSVIAGPVSNLAVTQISPASPTAGVGFSVTVQSTDSVGNPVNVSTNTDFSLSRGAGTAALGGTTTGTIAAGTNSFTVTGVTYNKAETISITATRTAGDTLAPGTSGTFAVVAAAASKLVVTTISPTSPIAGSSFSVTIQSQDPFNNVSAVVANTSVSLQVFVGTGTLGGTTTGTITSGTNSVTITGVTYTKAESGVQLTAHYVSGGNTLTDGQSAAFTVQPGTATKLAVTTISPTSPQAGATGFSVTVQSQDANGNPSNVGSRTTFSLSLATGTGTLGGTLTGAINNGGNNTTTVTGVTYTKAESGVSITATRTGGDTLTPGTSA